ncbi:hypothetical protein EG327_001239 [Venturia inaequalis]|uniref:Uncharacterized protein n=1 Tax=Venturia inaequalis TaxID=5025 RepID=A0A8H3ZFV3_VENIN|nr:hypothetical protein EG327_001239 [Venturia inaequalis]
MASKAIPSHLKPPGAGNGEAAEFARKHHGKSQSHMPESMREHTEDSAANTGAIKGQDN